MHSSANWQTLEEYDADEEALHASYVYGNYIDEVLSMRKDIDGAGTTHSIADYYFHADDLFNVVAVSSSAGDLSPVAVPESMRVRARLLECVRIIDEQTRS